MAKEIDPRRFVTTWQESESIEEVAQKLGVGVKTVYARALNYRKKGVTLKRFPKQRRTSTVNWDELKELAASLMPPEQLSEENRDMRRVLNYRKQNRRADIRAELKKHGFSPAKGKQREVENAILEMLPPLNVRLKPGTIAEFVEIWLDENYGAE